ncbi:hypothetical protein HC891_22750, partial [Candidatus Gracilibacteria bacterium]|nr:hypothetical protein [Candidatus Gracilibacteria bacterium]
MTISLFRTNGTLVDTVTSAANGVYTVSDLLAQEYYASFDLATTAAPTNTFVASPQLSNVTVDPTEVTYIDYSDVITQVNSTTWRTPIFSLQAPSGLSAKPPITPVSTPASTALVRSQALPPSTMIATRH